jgi:putative ABC transport system substrate-binding protein
MDRRRAVGVLVALSSGYLRCSFADDKTRIKRIGFHGSGSAQSMYAALDAFRQGMAALGWADGRDYVIDARYADNRADAIDKNAADLVATQPDVLLAPGDSSTRALLRRTKAIPIVFAIGTDPVRSGHAASLYRPGGNATGLTTLAPELAAKRLQLLREVRPGAVHIGVLFNPAEAQSSAQVTAYEEAAGRLDLRISRLEIKRSNDIEPAVKRGSDLRVDGFVVTQGALVDTHRSAISEALLRYKRAAISAFAQDAEAGILMAYAPDVPHHFRLAAGYVDKILKGAKAGQLAIEQPTKLNLVINLKTAKTLGLTIPSPVLLRADRVIQ